MRTRTGLAIAGVLGAGLATLAYAGLIERNRFTLRRYDVPILAPDAEPLRVLHVTDLHMMPDQRRKQDWVATLAALDPDLVLLTGDNMAHPGSLPAVVRALSPLLSAAPGAFVFGSNDYRGPLLKNPLGYFARDREYRLGQDREYQQGVPLPVDDLRDVLTGAGWADLNNARTAVKAGGRLVELVGVDDPHIDRDDYASVAGPARDDANVRIGLTHSPEPRVLDAMAADGFDLLAAGHTHGGQVRVPLYGALVTNCGIDRRRAAGLHRYGPSYLHVSAGLGTSPYAPVRFACPPEATLLTLVPSA